METVTKTGGEAKLAADSLPPPQFVVPRPLTTRQWLGDDNVDCADEKDHLEHCIVDESEAAHVAAQRDVCDASESRDRAAESADQVTTEHHGEDTGIHCRVRSAAEVHMQGVVTGVMSLLDLLRTELVSDVLGVITDTVEQLQILRDAIGGSDFIEVCGSRVVAKQLPCTDASFGWWDENGGFWPAVLPGFPTDGAMPADFANFAGVGVDMWTGQQERTPERQAEVRRFRICSVVARLLTYPPQEVIECMDSDGSVHVEKLFEVAPAFSRQMFGTASVVIRAIVATRMRIVDADEESQTVRLKSPAECLRMHAELLLERVPATQPMRLDELLEHSAIRHFLQLYSAAELEGTGLSDLIEARAESDKKSSLPFLRQALSQSDLLEIVDDEDGKVGEAVTRSPERLLGRVFERIMESDERAKLTLGREQEVAVSWILEHPWMLRALDRAQLPSGEASLEALHNFLETSKEYMLDDPCLCVRPRRNCSFKGGVVAQAANTVSTTLGLVGSGNVRAGSASSRSSSAASVRGGGALATASWGRGAGRVAWDRSDPRARVPSQKDAKAFRDLVKFYFDEFNLQHVRPLIVILQAQRNGGVRAARHVGYLRGSGQRPTFTVSNLRAIPRLAQLLDRYPQDAAACLLAAALQGQEGLPVRLSSNRGSGAPRGAWAAPSPRIELTYVPNLRFIESIRDGPEVKALVDSGPSPLEPLALPPHAFSVLSYSVSSDISHNQSPKTSDLLEDIMDGKLDPNVVTWEYRQQRIKRQLLAYSPDIICLQGLQSVGFADRCSEVEPSWFTCDDEPASNHLVHLYRQLSKENYGVAFAPTMKQPGSNVACFGNAIFWKRSRWQLVQRFGVQSSAIFVELASRLKGPRLLVCCSKPAASYARDWGDSVTDDELAESFLGVLEVLAEASDRRLRGGPRLLWCGDFSCEFSRLETAWDMDDDDDEEDMDGEEDLISDSANVEASSVSRDVDELLEVEPEPKTAEEMQAMRVEAPLIMPRSMLPLTHIEPPATLARNRDVVGMREDDMEIGEEISRSAAEAAAIGISSAMNARRPAPAASCWPMPEWRSVASSVLDDEPWTSSSLFTACRAVDFIIHEEGSLDPLATLGGLQNSMNLSELLRSGLPSDHLLQLAVFVDGAFASPTLHESAAIKQKKRLKIGQQTISSRKKLATVANAAAAAEAAWGHAGHRGGNSSNAADGVVGVTSLGVGSSMADGGSAGSRHGSRRRVRSRGLVVSRSGSVSSASRRAQ
eukprot:TRINITY_DN5981_c0_g1_i3.p1 TRINITY_DN5981_c0_g1~~TRINITY_DN5981_c0_g1_i3.p1  ORF type:complete len:1277 (+),score=236.88 TRINITY_DN5981_c0_g1_i3:82-3831(+)